MSTANELLAAACTSGISCLDEMNLLRVIAQGANAGGGGGGGGGGTLSTDGTFAANSDLLYPSQKAAKTYVDAAQAAAIASSNATADSLYVKKAGDTMTGALLLPAGAVGAPSLSRSGDTNTGVWFPAADNFAISTAGAERLRILSTGEVGIGTAAPNAKLQIQNTVAGLVAVGSARVLTLDGSGSLNERVEIGIGSLAGLLTSNSPGLVGFVTSDGTNFGKGDLYFATRDVTTNTAASVRMTILDDGNVGIGTTSPNEVLSILGSRAALYNTLTSATNFERLDFEWSGNVARIWTEKGSGGGTARDLVLGADATELLRFQTGSKLGFFGVTPVVRPPAYTPSNVTTDRSYDANSSTLDEIADVLGTLIADLQGLGLLQ